jgi:hypothetical protein
VTQKIIIIIIILIIVLLLMAYDVMPWFSGSVQPEQMRVSPSSRLVSPVRVSPAGGLTLQVPPTGGWFTYTTSIDEPGISRFKAVVQI